MTKMTYADALRSALTVVTDETVIARLTDLLTSIEKRSNAERKPSAKQIETRAENEALAQVLYNELFVAGKPLTVAEIRKQLPSFTEVSAPKVTALLKILILNAKVTKNDGKRVATYAAIA